MSGGLKKSPSNGFENSLTPEAQQAKINEVRRLVGPLPEKLSIYCSDASISRHLRARNWSVKKTTKMLKETLKWRAEYKPEEIRWNTKSTKGQIRYLVYCMENAILNLSPDQEQMVWLIDFHGFNLSHISLKVTKETAHVLQDHYPERLGLAILYNPPKFFEPFWMAAKVFLEPKTYNKVKFVYSDEVNTMKIMEELFDMDQLESAFGGKDNSGFDISKYAERMKEDDKRMPLLWTVGSEPSAMPQPALTSTASLDVSMESHSDASETDETDSSQLHGISTEIASNDVNTPAVDGGRNGSENVHVNVKTQEDQARA
ncbi:phosphatidylinositol transfer protein 3 isoform X2 [Manihot esculenta]|uniref:phosphatidylinositol transfer protein 3 isoform X2 n=1 Tax=Manihot esculenta TaxID=3983 RepID=UPI001CC37B16|nr:phosphatidylinositol transfer protein 3 isoform X2 [Manihot esculenta]